MSNVPSLQALANNRQGLLLAEVAAWLHDVGKFCILHIEAHSGGGSRKWSNNHAYKAVIDEPATVIRLSKASKAAARLKKPDALNNVLNAQSPKAADFLPQDAKDFLAQTVVRLPGQQYSLAELIMLGTPGFATDKNRAQLLDGKDGWLPAALGVCHNEAHHDKQEPASGQGAQKWPKVFISTAFGYEEKVVDVDARSSDNLDLRLKRLPWRSLLSSRQKLLEEFSFGLGDTRRPINEVTLADWASTVASLYKSALATWLLKGQSLGIRQWANWKEKLIDHDLRWRLLRVNFDVLGLYAKAVKIADLIGYQDVVERACAAVKQLVEEEYPLGNEIYRDTTGIYFTFPDIDLPADLAQEIRRCVEEIEPELAPYIAVEVPPGQTAVEQLKRMLAEGRKQALQDLAQPFRTENLSPCWKELWQNLPREGNWELCPVCRLRPMKEGQEACKTCLKRRQSRIEWWQKNPRQTIWIDEVADINGRLALIVGQFELDDWLSGDLVQSMLVIAVENDPANCVPKNLSPARLRRIWETTRKFWQEVLPTDQDSDLAQSLVGQVLGLAGPRLEIRGALQPQRSGDTLGPYHTYELVVKGVRVSLVWDSDNERFITCDNLDYLAKPDQLGAPLENLLTPEGMFTLEEPVGYGAKNKVWGNIAIEQVKPLDDNYTPAIPILAEPRTFMALVPANRALKVVKEIKAKYEREMSKVRNRLPLTVGVVYFGRRTPLAAALDAGRRMLKRAHNTEWWEVVCNCPRSAEEGLPEHLQTMCKGHFKRRQEIVLEKDGQKIVLHVSTMMGDGDTEDVWYPYWCVQGKPTDRTRWFSGQDGKCWVHVSELKNGDGVLFTPSTFDFEFLDTAGRRFEVTYENGRRRAGEKAQRPYWLEQVDKIEHTWSEMSTLSKSQIYQVCDLIENKRAEWGKPRGAQALALPQEDVFRRFVADVLREAGVYSEELERTALSGMLSDTLELYLEIMKENPQTKGGSHE